jgi:spermidine/putrescine-binding protein
MTEQQLSASHRSNEEEESLSTSRGLEGGRLTRRSALRHAAGTAIALGAAPAVLAACGDDDDGGSQQSADAGGTLDYLWWEGYDLQKIMGPWQKRNDIDVRTTFIGGNADIYAKVGAGGSHGIDLVGYTHGNRDQFERTGALSEMDEDLLPNVANLDPAFAKGSEISRQFLEVDGTRVGVPYYWNALGINYDSTKTDAPSSWSDVLDPKFKGKVAMIKGNFSTLLAACKALGLDGSKLTPDQVDQVKDFLEQVVAQSKTVSPSYGDWGALFASGEIVVSFPGFAQINLFAKEAGNPNVKTVYAQEGGLSFVESWAIPEGSDARELAHKWINQTLEPKLAGAAAEANASGSAVPAAADFVSAGHKELFDYSSIAEFFEENPATPFPPGESDEYLDFEGANRLLEEVGA